MALIQRCRLSKLGDLHDAEPFQLGLLGALLGQLEARPALPMPEATNLVPNIGVLLELVEDQAAAAPALLVRSVALLNLLPCHNSPTVRAKMKAALLFEARDALLFESLHRVAELPCEASLQLLAHLQPPVLREASVCLLLLLLLLDEVRLRVRVRVRVILS